MLARSKLCHSFPELEHSLALEKAEYEELTSKYELLEEEHVVTKARLTVDKEKAQRYDKIFNTVFVFEV